MTSCIPYTLSDHLLPYLLFVNYSCQICFKMTWEHIIFCEDKSAQIVFYSDVYYLLFAF